MWHHDRLKVILLITISLLSIKLPAYAIEDCSRAPPSLDEPVKAPVELLTPARSPTLVHALSFDVRNAAMSGPHATADLSVSVIVAQSFCSGAIRYPLGIVFHGASFDISSPQVINLPDPNGIANISFDSKALSDALKVLLPLPKGFSFVVRLEVVPKTFDGMSFAVDIEGPGPLGVVASGKWRVDRQRPDLGLGELVRQLLEFEIDLPKVRDEALSLLLAKLHARIDKYLQDKEVRLGYATAKKLRIDWDGWERGSLAASVDLAWDAELGVVKILPKTAVLRFDEASLRLIMAPVDPEQLRSYIADKIVAIAPDAVALGKMIERFGAENGKSSPLDWLRVRNVALTSETYSAEVAFSIGGDNVQWNSIRAPLPLRANALEPLVEVLAANATEAAKRIAQQEIEMKAIEAVDAFIRQNGTVTLFGIKWSVARKSAIGETSLLKPVVALSANDVTIDGVVLTVDNGLSFDFGRARITGLQKLADLVVAESGLGSGDLSLSASDLQLVDARLTGKIAGNFLGTGFETAFSIGQNDANFKLPGARAAIVASLQRALDGRQVGFSGLELQEFRLCPTGVDTGVCVNGAIGASVNFKVSDLFSGKLTLKLHPKIEIAGIEVDSSSGIVNALGLFGGGVVTINTPRQFSPLIISGTIKLSDLFDVVPLPDVPFEWSSLTGKVDIGMPTTIAIDTDIPVPPWLNLSQVRVPIGKSEDGAVRMGMRLTVGQHYVQYILNVDGAFEANPKARQVKVSGKLSILTLPLYQVDGTVDFDRKELTASSKSTGLLKAILPQESIIKILGERCLASQDDTIRFLFLEARGSLLIQLPPGFCGTAIPKAASDCGLTSEGGICLATRMSAGQLGSGEGRLRAGFDLDFNAAVNTNISLLGIGVDLGLNASSRELGVKAKIDAAVTKVKLGLTIARPENGSDASVRKILEQIIEALKKPNLKLPVKIQVNSGSDSGDVTVEADDGGDPSMSKMNADMRGGQPTASSPATQTTSDVATAPGQPTKPANPPEMPQTTPSTASPGSAPAPQPDAPGPTKPSNPKPADVSGLPPVHSDKPAGSATTSTKSVFAGPIAISFDPDNRISATDTRNGKTEVSAAPLDPAAIAALNGACTVRWFSNRGGSYIPAGAVQADAVVLNTAAGRVCAMPPNCKPSQFCALGLRNGGTGAGSVAIDGKFDWPNASDLADKPERASQLELGLITALAGAQLFPEQKAGAFAIDGAAKWTCVVPASDNANCRLALQRKQDGKVSAFVSQRGELVAIEEASLTSWAAQVPALTRDIFARQIDEAITLYGSGKTAWLVGVASPEGLQLKVFRRDGTEVRVRGAVLPVSGTNSIWIERRGDDPILDGAADLIADLSQANMVLEDLGGKGSSHRLLVSSEDHVWLLSRTVAGVCARRQVTAVIRQKLNTAANPASPSSDPENIASILKMSSDQWRVSGFRANPAIALFGNDCTRTLD